MNTPVPPRLHHVLFCVQSENHDAAADYWRDLGLTFLESVMTEKGIRVSIDLAAGIEIVSPLAKSGTETIRFRQFLDEHGEGIWSIAVQTPNVEDPSRVAIGHGTTIRHEHREPMSRTRYDEIDMDPLFGMPVTFVATDGP